MKKTRITAYILVVLLFLSLFAGCSGEEEDGKDILSLPQLAKELHTSVDTLLTGESAATPALPAKKPEELIVRISIHPEDDARVCLNLPFTVFRLGVQHDLISFSFHANEGEMDAEALVRELAQVDFRALVRLIEQGARGMLVNSGDTLSIWTE